MALRRGGRLAARLRRSFHARNPQTVRAVRRRSRNRGLQCRRLQRAGDDRPISLGNASIPQWQAQNLAHRACPEAGPGEVQCQLLILNESPQDKEPGWGARDIEAAYNLPSSSKGSGQIVAIVDAYDNPNVASDLAVYRRHYGLPKAKFYKYNQDGQQSHYPKGNPGWGTEIDLDVEMVSARCPNCTIYLIEANSNSLRSYDKAVNEAVKLGAHVISNSFECYGATGCDQSKAFDTPGVIYVAAAGDDGYGIGTPMAYRARNLGRRHDPLEKRFDLWRDRLAGHGRRLRDASRQALVAARSRLLGTDDQRRGGRRLECRRVRHLRQRWMGCRRRHERCDAHHCWRVRACRERHQTRRRQNFLDANAKRSARRICTSSAAALTVAPVV